VHRFQCQVSSFVRAILLLFSSATFVFTPFRTLGIFVTWLTLCSVLREIVAVLSFRPTVRV
jgi:hypothetical protein